MWIVGTELRARADQGRPIRVGIVGAGFMCQGLTNQIVNSTPGMRVVAISNRRPERAVAVFNYAGCEDVVVAESQFKFDDAAARATGGDRGPDAPRTLAAYRRAGRCHRLRRMRRPSSRPSCTARTLC